MKLPPERCTVAPRAVCHAERLERRLGIHNLFTIEDIVFRAIIERLRYSRLDQITRANFDGDIRSFQCLYIHNKFC